MCRLASPLIGLAAPARGQSLIPARDRGMPRPARMASPRRLSRIWLTSRLCAALAILLPQQVHAAALEVTSLAKSPTIDGEIEEAEWAGVAIADQNFVQIEPEFAQPSPFRTVVRVAQT